MRRKNLVFLFSLVLLIEGSMVIFAQEEGGKPAPISQQTQGCLGCHREVVNQ